MSKVITVMTPRGGVGKTGLSAALGSYLESALVIDCDVQLNLSVVMKADMTTPSLYDVMEGSCHVRDAVQATGNGYVLPSSPTLAGLVTLKPDELTRALKPIKKDFEYIIIDLPPSINALAYNALIAADCVIAPVLPDSFSLMALRQLEELISVARNRDESKAKLYGILVSRFNSRSILHKRIYASICGFAEQIGETDLAIKAPIVRTVRECVAFSEANTLCMPLWDYAPKAKATVELREFIDKILERIDENVSND